MWFAVVWWWFGVFPRTLTGRIFSQKIFPFDVNLPFIIIIIIIIITQHKSRPTCPNSEFLFHFYIYYTELSYIANDDLLDWYFITQQNTYHNDNFSSGLYVCTCSLTW